MPKKPRPHSPTYTDTVGVTPDPVAFGATATVEYSSSDSAPWAHITIYGNDTTVGQNPGVLQTTYLDLFRGNTTFILGPTPSWEGGGGNGEIQLVNLANGIVTVLSDTYTFTVTP